jgi:hypothetical protein
MLSEHPITPVLLATDLPAARELPPRQARAADRKRMTTIAFRCGTRRRQAATAD